MTGDGNLFIGRRNIARTWLPRRLFGVSHRHRSSPYLLNNFGNKWILRQAGDTRNVFDSLGNHYLLFSYSFMTKEFMSHLTASVLTFYLRRKSTQLWKRARLDFGSYAFKWNLDKSFWKKPRLPTDPLGLKEKLSFSIYRKNNWLETKRTVHKHFSASVRGLMEKVDGTSMFF